MNNELPVLLLSLKIDNDLLDQYSELRLECRAAFYETVANFQTKLNVHVQQQLQTLPISLANGVVQSIAGWSSQEHGWPKSSPSASLSPPSRSKVNRRRKKRPLHDQHRLNLFNQLDYEQSSEDGQTFGNVGENRFSQNEISALRNHQTTLHRLRVKSVVLFFLSLLPFVFKKFLSNF